MMQTTPHSGTGLGRMMRSRIALPVVQPKQAEQARAIAHVDLASYDVIVISTSGGKDSQAMLAGVVSMAREQGVLDRVVAVHCDLGRVEWAGTRELAEEQARLCGVRFEVVSRRQGDLLEHVEQRRMWPGPATRYCTSDHKRAQVDRVMTALVAEARAKLGSARPVRVLSARGERAQESRKRAKLLTQGLTAPYRDARASNTRRHVDTWHPILEWTTDEVWAAIRASGLPHHKAYDLGMPRLSCVFCVLANRDALLVAGHHNPGLLDEYVRVERAIGHTFQQGRTIESIRDAVRAGERPAGRVASWGEGESEKGCGG